MRSRVGNMLRLCAAFAAISAFVTMGARAQGDQDKGDKPAAEKPHPVSKSGKKLLGTDDILRIKSISGAKLSPDGAHVAFTASTVETNPDEPSEEWKSRTELWIVPLAGPDTAARQYTHPEQNVASPTWSPDGKRIAFLRGTPDKEGERQVWFQWLDGGDPERVTSHKGGLSSVVFSPDGQKLLLTATDQPSKEEDQRKKEKDDAIVVDHDLKMSHVWLYDIASKKETRLTEGDFTVSDAQWSPDGSHISFTSNPTPRADDGDLTAIWVLDVASKQKRRLVSGDAPNHTARWSADSKWIAYLGTARAGGVRKTDLYVIPADGGSPRKLSASFELDANTPFWSQDGKTIYFSSESRETVQIFAASVAAGTVAPITDLPGTFQLADITHDGATAVGIYSDSQRPGEISRIPIGAAGAKTVTRMTNLNRFLDDYAIADAEVVKWRSKDGTQIEGVLTKPVDFDASRKYPFLLNPHGGPTGASLANFNSQAQLMAANGYLVLQPNFRGSTGRGEAFAAANRNSWGKGDYEDCISGVQSIVERGWADPDRLGAFGWSYGGYMTFWILTQTNMFKAVSPGAGLTDLAAMYSQNDIQRYLRWFFDDKSPWDNYEMWWDHSPMKYVEQVKTPTLILQGQVDTRVPMAQAQEFYRALLERGVPVEFVLYPRENHGFTEPRHIQDRLRRYLTFFGKYLNNPSVTDPPGKSTEGKEKAAEDQDGEMN